MRGRRRSPRGAGYSDHRGFRSGGGFRRNGQPKPSSYAALPPPPPPPPPLLPPPQPLRSREDVLMAAGRLAAEYLVAKGEMPASSLPPPTAERWWPRGGGEEGGRPSALSRLGRRPLDDEEGEEGSFVGRKRARRRRNRCASYGRRGSEWGHENGRSGAWTEAWEEGGGYYDAIDDDDVDRSRRWSGRGKGAMDPMEDEGSDRPDQSEDSGLRDGRPGGREALKAATSNEQLLPSKGKVTGGSELDLENHTLALADQIGSRSMEEMEMKTNPVSEADMIVETRSDDNKVSGLEVVVVRKVKGSVEADQQNGLRIGEEEDPVVKTSPVVEDKQICNHGISLLSGFAQAPKKPRTSVANRNPRIDQKPGAQDMRENSDVTVKERVTDDIAEQVSGVSRLNDALTYQLQNSEGRPSGISTASSLSDSLADQRQSSIGIVPVVSSSQSAQLVESVECCFMEGTENRSCSRSHSFTESSPLSEGPPGFELPRESIHAEIDESLAGHNKREAMKQPREWSPSSLSKMDGYLHSSESKQFDMPVEKLSQDHEMVDTIGEDHVAKFAKATANSVKKFGEERKLASTSFKIFDLNLMETPEITDVSSCRVLERVPTSAVPVETDDSPSVNFDLSIYQRQNESDSHSHHTSDSKIIPVIDLEDDPQLEINASQTRREQMYPNLDNFLNQPANPVGLPNIQDGYGLAISEFLGNEIAGCPAVQGDLQPFNGVEGIAGNDDSLYVTLGEIPLNFMDVWDQPPPEYEKFF